jgi:tyramine---L-glutamate ligase
MKVWVFEYVSASATASAPKELLMQGRAMRDALVDDLLDVDGCDVDVARDDEPHATALERVRRQATSGAHEAVWVIAPESDGLLQRLCAATPPQRWIGCDLASINQAASKRATLEHLSQAGIATPLAFMQQARLWVVKPDDGAGALDTLQHTTLAWARADFGSRRRIGLSATLEAWVEGEALSLSLLCDRGSARLLAVNRQKIRVDDQGVVGFDGVAVNAMPANDARMPALRSTAQQVAAAMPGLRGFVGIDVVWHASRGPVVIEVNPRLTSAYVGLSAVLGFNVAAEVLALFVAPTVADV